MATGRAVGMAGEEEENSVVGGVVLDRSASRGMAMKLGFGLMLGGIAQLLAPTPKPDAEEKSNYSFGGVVNTTQQGVAIPLCYGQLMVGGAVISSGMNAEDY